MPLTLNDLYGLLGLMIRASAELPRQIIATATNAEKRRVFIFSTPENASLGHNHPTRSLSADQLDAGERHLITSQKTERKKIPHVTHGGFVFLKFLDIEGISE